MAILNTSVANATVLGTMAPVWIVLGARWFLKEPAGHTVHVGLAFAFAGAVVLVGRNASLSSGQLFGDLCGIVTSIFLQATCWRPAMPAAARGRASSRCKRP